MRVGSFEFFFLCESNLLHEVLSREYFFVHILLDWFGHVVPGDRIWPDDILKFVINYGRPKFTGRRGSWPRCPVLEPLGRPWHWRPPRWCCRGIRS